MRSSPRATSSWSLLAAALSRRNGSDSPPLVGPLPAATDIRVAKGLNKLWARRGKVFADHYHDRILRTPREVRNALCYVLHNAKKHGLR